jgi:hypothetical protein
MAKAKKKKARTTLIVLTSDQDFQKALETMGRATKENESSTEAKGEIATNRATSPYARGCVCTCVVFIFLVAFFNNTIGKFPLCVLNGKAHALIEIYSLKSRGNSFRVGIVYQHRSP